ncbi:hypothetical protein [Streptomyces chrestomyceticus]|uniref:hypothetical protein n=1 Tax=Streptomyces chrestomyceticus TaxID=68185 RepID=UPI0019D2796A|nr:hypothetical protein [Streptomyces chrestomyceticus]
MSKNIQAFSAVQDGDGWKYLALAADEYVIYHDSGIEEGPAEIGRKWPFLPDRFQDSIDAASVVSEYGEWKYTFIKGNEAVFFKDSGLVEGPEQVTDKWSFLKDWLES